MRHLISSLVAALSFAILACTTVPGDKTLLDFLGDGATTRETALFKLGEPSGTFDRDRILTYRIGSPKDGGYLLLHPHAAGTEYNWSAEPGVTLYSLVLVFDEKDILVKHSLVRVR
ncbi:hypothetical protein [Paraburkholderia caribensis]|uniref:hypothetical protein n=1 Tax=Paraburkholderia caribensis TaxID=75105 RepID=UPI0006D3E845|nr:hypothetical protein [Paraburkholderia caribensis]ALP66020.1 hypothetical protein AN416_26345 [Paraburkholderia caribensis]AMV45983.1 hypothetical protein ATN79_29005 [Paraburkholderia caribensis]CAG9213470.1 conserved exported hypothetical protein [Paraburkholderia caribensis]